jgi:hypothetical protein
MLSRLIVAGILMALCVTIHAAGLITALRRIKHLPAAPGRRFPSATVLLIGVAGWTILLHLLQIAVWAFFYAWKDAMPDLHAAFYFSAVTYTTTGYGDLILPEQWRLVGGVEALTGILMCGLSTGFFFAVFAKTFGIVPADSAAGSNR